MKGLRPIINRLSAVQAHDDGDAQKVKHCVVVAALTTAVVGVLALALTELEDAVFFILGAGLAVAASVGAFGYLHATKAMSMRVLKAYTAVLCVCVLLIDFDALASMTERKWPLFLLLVNLLLCCGANKWFVRAMVAVMVVWLFVTMLESSYRWGWFDSDGTVSREERLKTMMCVEPPCKTGIDDGIRSFVVTACVVLFNYFFGAQNTCEVLAGIETLEDGYALTEGVIDALARYDTDSAEKFLSEAYTPPVAVHNPLDQAKSPVSMSMRDPWESVRMQRAKCEYRQANTDRLCRVLSRLVLSLTHYRPHLSDGLFSVEPPLDSPRGGAGTAPSLESVGGRPAATQAVAAPTSPKAAALQTPSKMAVVFVSVAQAASLWRSNSCTMKVCSRIYGECMRALCIRRGGQIVKSIGDTTMLTFSNAVDACNFALQLQKEMVLQDWPKRLDRYPCCAEVPGVWSGLRLKIGVDNGGVSVQHSEVSGALEYAGPTVRKAFLIHRCSVVGTVTVSEDVVSIVRRREYGTDYDGSDFEKLHCPIVISMGDFQQVHATLPAEYLTAMLPTELSGRKPYVLEVLQKRFAHKDDVKEALGAATRPTFTKVDRAETASAPCGNPGAAEAMSEKSAGNGMVHCAFVAATTTNSHPLPTESPNDDKSSEDKRTKSKDAVLDDNTAADTADDKKPASSEEAGSDSKGNASKSEDASASDKEAAGAADAAGSAPKGEGGRGDNTDSDKAIAPPAAATSAKAGDTPPSCVLLRQESDVFYIRSGTDDAQCTTALPVYGTGASGDDDRHLLDWLENDDASAALAPASKLALLGFGKLIRELAPGEMAASGGEEEVVRDVAQPLTGDDAVFSVPTAVIAAPPRPLSTSATTTQASFSRANVNLSDPTLSARVTEVVLNCVERTDGMVLSVLGGGVNVGWNMTRRRSDMHAQSSVRFIEMAYRLVRYGYGSDCQLSVGLSCGKVTWGVLGTNCLRFTTAEGKCVGLASTLAESAAHLDTYCLYASTQGRSAELYNCLSTLMRPVDTWEVRSMPSPLVVYEINAARLPYVPVVVMVPDADEEVEAATPWGWSPDYVAAFESGNHAAMVENAPTDRTALQAAKLLEHNTHLRLPMQL